MKLKYEKTTVCTDVTFTRADTEIYRIGLVDKHRFFVRRITVPFFVLRNMLRDAGYDIVKLDKPHDP